MPYRTRRTSQCHYSSVQWLCRIAETGFLALVGCKALRALAGNGLDLLARALQIQPEPQGREVVLVAGQPLVGPPVTTRQQLVHCGQGVQAGASETSGLDPPGGAGRRVG